VSSEPKTAPFFLVLRDGLLAAVELDDRSTTNGLLRDFAARVGNALVASDPDRLAKLRAQTARLRRRVAGLDAEPLLSGYVDGQLLALDVVLDAGRTALRLRDASEERQRRTEAIRDSIVLALAMEPRRPRDLAQEIDCDPSQVSRELRRLQEEGVVALVDAPPGHSDARARWFGFVGLSY
jgi:predicted Rossmann fold nucleotide-binding protein DprA/Smf involved in DNA uptake